MMYGEFELLGELEAELEEEEALELAPFFSIRVATGGSGPRAPEFEAPRTAAFEFPPASGIIDPLPNVADYADLARAILRKRIKSNKLAVVLSIVRVSSGGRAELIDRRTEIGRSGRPYLKNPPAHVVMPPEVYEIEWKPKRGKPLKVQFVWIMSNEKSVFPVGGILFLTPWEVDSFYLATFNTGSLDEGSCTNAHHAEMHATGVFPDRKGFINAQPRTWRERVATIDIWNLSRKRGLGYSPCKPCCEDLAGFLRDLRALRSVISRASITWLTLYDRYKACGHPTEAADLRKLASAGWSLNGPGWTVISPLGRPFSPRPPTTPVTAPPNDIAGRDLALTLAGRTPANAQILQKWADSYRHAFAKAFADTLLELTRDGWQARLAGLRSLSARSYQDLPSPTAPAALWQRWIPSQRAQRMVSIAAPTDDFVTRFRAYERMLMFALAAWLRRRIPKTDADQAKAVALQQASAAGIAAAVQYVRARGLKQWNAFIALVRTSGLSDDEISKQLEPLAAAQLPLLSRAATRTVPRIKEGAFP